MKKNLQTQVSVLPICCNGLLGTCTWVRLLVRNIVGILFSSRHRIETPYEPLPFDVLHLINYDAYIEAKLLCEKDNTSFRYILQCRFELRGLMLPLS